MALEIFEGAFQAFFIMLCKVFRHYSVLWVAILILEETSVFGITLQFYHRIVLFPF